MDKNTVWGLVLMALVFFAFMWFSPKNEENTAAEDKTATEQTAAENSQLTPDSLSTTEMGWLAENTRVNGEPRTEADGSTVSELRHGDLDLRARGDSVWGTVKIDGKEVAFSDVLAADLTQMTVAQQRAAVTLIRETSTSVGRYGRFAKFLNGEDHETVLENDVLKLTLNSKSGVITRAELKKYDTEYSSDETKSEKRPVVIFDKSNGTMNFRLPLPQPIESKDLYFDMTRPNDTTVLMALNVGSGAMWGIRYTLPKGDSYLVGMEIVQKNMAPVVQSNNRILGVDWTQRVRRQEKGRMFEERNSGLYYKFAGGDVENLSESKNDSEERQAKVSWIGFKNQFFSSVLVSHKNFNMSDFTSTIEKGNDYLKDLEAHAEVNDYDWTSERPAAFSLYIGPNLYPLLSHVEDNIIEGEDLELTRLIPLGWALFRWINVGVVIPVFSFLGKFISNYGIIILLLTIFIKLVLFPLTYKSYKSQAKMRILAPDIKAINDKYPGNDNAMLRNQKTMALYSKAGASPMSGCLPMLLQMPILFAMFTFFPSAIELRGESFLWAHDLSAPDAIISWSGNIPLVTEYFGNHISLFCLLMTVTNIIYTYINMQNSPGQMPGMKWMMYLMPVFFMIFFNNYASGLSYYYFLSLLITIMQTYAFRLVIKEESVRKAMAEAAKKPKKKSGFMARLEEMQRQQQQMLKEQQKKQRR